MFRDIQASFVVVSCSCGVVWFVSPCCDVFGCVPVCGAWSCGVLYVVRLCVLYADGLCVVYVVGLCVVDVVGLYVVNVIGL